MRAVLRQKAVMQKAVMQKAVMQEAVMQEAVMQEGAGRLSRPGRLQGRAKSIRSTV